VCLVGTVVLPDGRTTAYLERQEQGALFLCASPYLGKRLFLLGCTYAHPEYPLDETTEGFQGDSWLVDGLAGINAAVRRYPSS
jgi:hypothetical protein